MLRRNVLEQLCCPSCDHDAEMTLGSRRRPDLVCEDCGQHYPIIDGIPDLVAPDNEPNPGSYRTETLANVIAGVYDFVAPLMSMAIWRCSPLRYVDHENRALGRAQGGVYAEVPIGTGIALGPVVAPHHDALILGIDKSWNMLHKAKQRLEDIPADYQLIRADYTNLPLRTGAVRSLQSLNGLHGFTDRAGVLAEFHRCLEDDGFFSGSALVRTQTDVADAFLEQYERYGIYPMLRSPEFLLREVRSTRFEEVRFETYGAVMFFTGEKTLPSPTDAGDRDNSSGGDNGDPAVSSGRPHSPAAGGPSDEPDAPESDARAS